MTMWMSCLTVTQPRVSTPSMSPRRCWGAAVAQWCDAALVSVCHELDEGGRDRWQYKIFSVSHILVGAYTHAPWENRHGACVHECLYFQFFIFLYFSPLFFTTFLFISCYFFFFASSFFNSLTCFFSFICIFFIFYFYFIIFPIFFCFSQRRRQAISMPPKSSTWATPLMKACMRPPRGRSRFCGWWLVTPSSVSTSDKTNLYSQGIATLNIIFRNYGVS